MIQLGPHASRAVTVQPLPQFFVLFARASTSGDLARPFRSVRTKTGPAVRRGRGRRFGSEAGRAPGPGRRSPASAPARRPPRSAAVANADAPAPPGSAGSGWPARRVARATGDASGRECPSRLKCSPRVNRSVSFRNGAKNDDLGGRRAPFLDQAPHLLGDLLQHLRLELSLQRLQGGARPTHLARRSRRARPHKTCATPVRSASTSAAHDP